MEKSLEAKKVECAISMARTAFSAIVLDIFLLNHGYEKVWWYYILAGLSIYCTAYFYYLCNKMKNFYH